MNKKSSSKISVPTTSLGATIRRRFDRRDIAKAALVFSVTPVVAVLAGGLSILSDNHNRPLLEAANAASTTIMNSPTIELEQLPLADVEELRNNALWGKTHLVADRSTAIPAFEKIDAILVSKIKE